MNKNSEIFSLLKVEEGVRHNPYIDSLGYPTVGVGFKLGPQGANLK
ncbi:lysozyme, partial [Salmonella enterica subsp. houtenae]|nr:lysozyme [Salmonella enterica subsp. houtenae]